MIRTSDCIRRPALMVRVVVPIILFRSLKGHAQKAAGVPLGCTLLHEPGRACVPQGVRHDFQVSPGLEASRNNRGSKRKLDILQGLAAIGDDELVFRKSPPPGYQVFFQARGQPRARALLLGPSTPDWVPIDDVAVEIDIRTTQKQDRFLPLASQQTDQEKQGQVFGF